MQHHGFRGDRVHINTDPDINRRLLEIMQSHIQRHATGDPRIIDGRAEFLNYEWDIERMLELGLSGAAFIGLILGIFSSRKWLMLPFVSLPYLIQHAVFGQCVPGRLLRRLGARTQREIEAERYALKSLQKERTNHPSGQPAVAAPAAGAR